MSSLRRRWWRPARAEVESARVKQGLAAYDALDYARAIALLEQARGESLTREEKILTYRTLGMAYVASGEPTKAKADFEHLLRLDPSAELDRSVAPKVRAVFEQAKAEAATSARAMAPALPTVTPQVTPPHPREGHARSPVHVLYPGGLARKMSRLLPQDRRHRSSRAPPSTPTAPATSMPRCPGSRCSRRRSSSTSCCSMTAGASVAAAGSLGTPLSVSVTRAKKPVYKKGWFWARHRRRGRGRRHRGGAGARAAARQLGAGHRQPAVTLLGVSDDNAR